MTTYDPEGNATTATASYSESISMDKASAGLNKAAGLVSNYKQDNGESPCQTLASQTAEHQPVCSGCFL